MPQRTAFVCLLGRPKGEKEGRNPTEGQNAGKDKIKIRSWANSHLGTFHELVLLTLYLVQEYQRYRKEE